MRPGMEGLDIGAARNQFPRGLSQPEKGFRFSLDALLLAAFAGSRGASMVLDLGAGCGVVGLALALAHPALCVAGLDHDGEMLAHARANCRRLGLEDRVAVVRGDVRHRFGIKPESVDMVVCNPPYRDPGTGRTCAHDRKSAARFECGVTLEDFVRMAAWSVCNKRPCVFIHLAERCDELLALLRTHRLQPKELLFVHPRLAQAARLVLVLAVKNGGAGLVVSPALVLHEGWGVQSGISAQALDFCPWLGCNAGLGAGDGHAV